MFIFEFLAFVHPTFYQKFWNCIKNVIFVNYDILEMWISWKMKF